MMPSKRLGSLWCGRLVVFAFLALVSSRLALDSGFAQASKESHLQVRQKTFDVVWKTINEKYLDASFGGIDWAAIRQRYAPQVATIQTDIESRDLLTRMLGEIGISHLHILAWLAVAAPSAQTPSAVQPNKQLISDSFQYRETRGQ